MLAYLFTLEICAIFCLYHVAFITKDVSTVMEVKHRKFWNLPSHYFNVFRCHMHRLSEECKIICGLKLRICTLWLDHLNWRVLMDCLGGSDHTVHVDCSWCCLLRHTVLIGSSTVCHLVILFSNMHSEILTFDVYWIA